MTISDFVLYLYDTYLYDYQVPPLKFTTAVGLRKTSYHIWAVQEIMHYVADSVPAGLTDYHDYICSRMRSFKRMAKRFSTMGRGGDAYQVFLTATDVADEILVYLRDL